MARWELDKAAQPYEAKYLKVDSSKARAALKWVHRLPVDAALAFTAKWYKAWHEGAQAKELCLQQIQEFETLKSENMRIAA